MTTRRQQLLSALGRVDWLRLAQRASVFYREARGDSADDIRADNDREIARSKNLREAVENWARNATRGPS